VTSTYFEGQAKANAKAARGHSRDQRPDCKQVNLGLVVTPEGLPIGYEIFAGNTADVTTVEDRVRLMEEKYGQAKRIWVLDRGMISEDRAGGSAHFGLLPEPGSVAHPGNVDERPRAGHLRPAVDQRSGHRAKYGCRAASQRSSEPKHA